MASLNRVTLIGNLGRDPERKDLAGTTACAFTLATRRSWTDKASGEKKEATDWHRVVAWGRQAELCCDYLQKGSQVYVEGRIETREYTDKDGMAQRITEIKMQNVQFLGSKPSGLSGGVGNAHATAASAPANRYPPPPGWGQDADIVGDGEVPF